MFILLENNAEKKCFFFSFLFCFCLEQLQSEVEKPLLTFRENFKKDMKRFDHHIADLRKQLVSRYAAVEKVTDVLLFGISRI